MPELGSSNVRLPVRGIVFNHDRDKNSPLCDLVEDTHYDATAQRGSAYRLAVRTWDGQEVTLRKADALHLNDGYPWQLQRRQIKFLLGAAESQVGFDKVQRIEFKEKGESDIRMTTTSGTVIDASLGYYFPEWCLGGLLEEFGPARISLADVASFEVSKEPAPEPPTGGDQPPGLPN